MTITPTTSCEQRLRRGPRARGRRRVSASGEANRWRRSIILGVVGDSAAGKTTLTRGLVRVLGEDNVTHVCVDDYHRYDRRQRAERNITPLHPDCNYMDIMAQHLAHLRDGEPFLKPVYQHHDGTFGPLVRVEPKRFAVVEGLLGYYTEELREPLRRARLPRPPEELRRKWKVQRDCSRRGYTTDQVLSELDRREPDSEAFIRPQQRYADIVVSFLPRLRRPGAPRRGARRCARRSSIPTCARCSTARPTARRDQDRRSRRRDAPAASPAGSSASAPRRSRRRSGTGLHFASHLRSERLGEFTIGTDLHRSESLALIQLLILYHLFTATASAALGGVGGVARRSPGLGLRHLVEERPRAAGARGSRSRRARPRSRGTTQETRIDEVEMISMLIPASASASKMSAATPGWLFIPAPTTETLAMSGSDGEAGGADRVGETARGSARRARELVLGQRERDVGVPLGRGVLDDHVDVDPGVRERPEDAAGDARLVGHAEDRHLRLAGVVRDRRR